MGINIVKTEGGEEFASLANDISDALHKAMVSGMRPDDTFSVAATVLADYSRGMLGDGALYGLCTIIALRAGKPLPQETE